MNVVVSGASGFLGRHVLDALMARGHRPIALTRDPARLAGTASVDATRSAEAMAEALRGESPDAYLHLAGVYRSAGTRQLFEINVGSAARLLEAVLSAGVRRVVNAGSALPAHVDGYALSKDLFARWAAFLVEEAGAHLSQVALQAVYGPGDSPERFVTQVVRGCLAGGDVPLTAGTARRDFLFVTDAAAALVVAVAAAVEQPVPAKNAPLTTLEAGTGEPVAIREIAETIQRLVGGSARLDFGGRAARRGEPDVLTANGDALRALGFRPAVGLEEGLRRTIEFERALRERNACAS